MSTQPKTYLPPEQYLEIERKAEWKSEYFQGEMFAMSGARIAHIRIVGNASASLHQQLLDQPCEALSSEMRVRVTPVGLYTYPDIVVVCGEPQFADDTFDTLLNPSVIIEVLSESTEAYDRGRKFELYQSLESLSDYLLISSQRISVTLFTRQANNQWLSSTFTHREDSLDLPSVGCHVRLADLYHRIEFKAEAAPERVP